MESAKSLERDQRRQALDHWLHTKTGVAPESIIAMQGDASTRRYFRLSLPEGSRIVMDAPPPQENAAAFVAIADALRQLGIKTPDIFAADLQQGFLLLSDFGDTTYLKALNAQNADTLYGYALDALATFQACRDVPGRIIPPFDNEWLWREWTWHQEWFLEKWLGLTLSTTESAALTECYARLVNSALEQPQVFMHRDYHAGNLMVLKDDVGVLDFQDAFIGPLTYDLASMLRDCYIDWDNAKVKSWACSYLKRLHARDEYRQINEATFMQGFDWMGVQRHLKALLTFARKHVRDHQPQYLQHVPRTLNYIIDVSAHYPELKALHDYYAVIVKPRMQEALSTCAP